MAVEIVSNQVKAIQNHSGSEMLNFSVQKSFFLFLLSFFGAVKPKREWETRSYFIFLAPQPKSFITSWTMDSYNWKYFSIWSGDGQNIRDCSEHLISEQKLFIHPCGWVNYIEKMYVILNFVIQKLKGKHNSPKR